MPKVSVAGKSVEVPAGTKLVTAIEQLGIDIGHRCGGKARCTTCRVTFESGEPDRFTRPEYRKLVDAGLLDQARLSCQVLVEGDMTVQVLKTLQSEGWTDTGPAVETLLTPEVARHPRAQLDAEPHPSS
jgi:ferredoxin